MAAPALAQSVARADLPPASLNGVSQGLGVTGAGNSTGASDGVGSLPGLSAMTGAVPGLDNAASVIPATSLPTGSLR